MHQIVLTFGEALARLGKPVSPLDVERWGIDVHHALASRARDFHTHQHILEMVKGADPLEALAALYHDIVYVHVDLELPTRVAQLVAPLLGKDELGWKLLPAVEHDPSAFDVAQVFGRTVDEPLTPFSGLNELASALIFSQQLAFFLTREERLAVAACIEATIPFRSEIGARLAKRLTKMGLAEPAVTDIVRRAIRVANRDVANFSESDPARFLDNTWKLLPETNPSLNTPEAYTVSEYRVALAKMHRFLSGLDAGRVFHQWGGEPSDEEYARLVKATRRNVDLAVRYLRAKLYATAVIEALAVETGGDVPIDYFMGGIPGEGDTLRRAEQYLPEVTDASAVDLRLLLLLEGGRNTPTRFDTARSPMAAYIMRSMGEPVVSEGFERALGWWAGRTSASEFLDNEPSGVVVPLARATAQVADTRRSMLHDLADNHGKRPARAPEEKGEPRL